MKLFIVTGVSWSQGEYSSTPFKSQDEAYDFALDRANDVRADRGWPKALNLDEALEGLDGYHNHVSAWEL